MNEKRRPQVQQPTRSTKMEFHQQMCTCATGESTPQNSACESGQAQNEVTIELNAKTGKTAQSGRNKINQIYLAKKKKL